MKTRNRVAPTARPDSTTMKWCRFVSAACLDFDWSQIAADTIRDPRIAAVVGKGLESLGRYIQREIDRVEVAAATDAESQPPTSRSNHSDADVQSAASVEEHESEPDAPDDPPTAPPIVDERAQAAAALLAVDVDATEDDIRAALRARLASSKLHPDHGGDGEEAKRLIAAKNLLIDRAKAART